MGFRIAKHRHGEELCRVYVRHWHLGPVIWWWR